MNLHDIFDKDITRNIDGVIKADDARHLGTEVSEYVLTNEAEKAVANLLEAYTNYTTANGVWISGFFGSGKSHMLKMLAHLLGDVVGQDFPRAEVSETFKTKTNDSFLKASLTKAEKISARSILFNIDQVADASGGNKTDAILKVFVKVFNSARGYYDMQPHVARLERDLEGRGLLDAFRTTYAQVSGLDWEAGRELDVLEEPNVAAAYAQVNGSSAGAPENILEKYRDSYTVSVDSFADEVIAWLATQEQGFRLNFFVDEVGQFIGDDRSLMLQLQSIAETLNSKGDGRAWVFVTSQEALDKTIGDQTKSQQFDFSKIQARFSNRVSLTSADVEEVIRKRLLDKSDLGKSVLGPIYSAEHGNFKTFFDFADGGKTYRNYPDEALFVGTYPFVNYQFPLFQAALVGLSDHNAFTGRHQAVGERSMLGVVQQVVKGMDSAPVGTLAPFDAMFEGISETVQSSAKRAIDVASKNLPDLDTDSTKLAIRILKALFLVKYVDGFRSTPRNITALMYDRFGLDLAALSKDVKEALALLESQSYIQRNGETYEYLTSEEQDVEKEIKTVDIDGSEVAKRLYELLQQNVIKTNKYRYATGQDYAFGYKIDDAVHGPQHALTVHVITPGYPHDLPTIRLHSTGLDEARVVIGTDDGLFADLRLLLKTEKYVKQKQTTSITQVQQRILGQKAELNRERGKEILERLRVAVGKATLVVHGVDVASSSAAADQRVFDALATLVAKTYPQLSLLGGKTYSNADLRKLVLPPTDGFDIKVDTVLTDVANEVYSVGIKSQVDIGQRVDVKKIIERFTGKPYGWDQGSILATIAHLYGDLRIKIELSGNERKRSDVPSDLANSQQYGNLRIDLRKDYDQSKVTAFRKFVQDFFDEPDVPKDALEAAHAGSEKLTAMLKELKADKSRYEYPFIGALDAPIAVLEGVVGKTDEWYVTEFDEADELLEAKAETLDKVRAFLNGQQRVIYDGAQRFLTSAADNLSYLPRDAARSVQTILDDRNVFRGNKIAQLQTAADTLRQQLDDVIKDEQTAAASAIEERRIALAGTDEYRDATPEAQTAALDGADAARDTVWDEQSIAKIKLAASNFATVKFPRLLDRLIASAVSVPPAPDPGPTDEPSPKTPDPIAPARSIALTEVTVSHAKHVLATAQDVDNYLAALRTALLNEINDGKRITR